MAKTSEFTVDDMVVVTQPITIGFSKKLAMEDYKDDQSEEPTFHALDLFASMIESITLDGEVIEFDDMPVNYADKLMDQIMGEEGPLSQATTKVKRKAKNKKRKKG